MAASTFRARYSPGPSYTTLADATGNRQGIFERGFDGGNWYRGALTAHGTTVGATSWLDQSGQIHIRVYVGDDSGGPITEHCWDKDQWYVGGFQGNGTEASAVSWFDGQVHIRLYVRAQEKVTEHGWDGNGWYNGGYTD